MGAEVLPFLLQDIHASPSEQATRFRVRAPAKFGSSESYSAKRFFSMILLEKIGCAGERPRGWPLWVPGQSCNSRAEAAGCSRNYFHSSIKEAATSLLRSDLWGVAILTNAVQQSEWSGMCAIWALGQHPAAGTNVIPFLIRATSSSSEGTACGAHSGPGAVSL